LSAHHAGGRARRARPPRSSRKTNGLLRPFPRKRESGFASDAYAIRYSGFPLARERAAAAVGRVAAALLLAMSSVHAAGTVAAGRQKALQCQTCHGLDGMSKLPEAPNIGGQPEPYLVRALDDFRKGVRSNDMMSIVAKALSDQDIADLAAYYAAIEITATPPR
jgi:cytochrome c553